MLYVRSRLRMWVGMEKTVSPLGDGLLHPAAELGGGFVIFVGERLESFFGDGAGVGIEDGADVFGDGFAAIFGATVGEDAQQAHAAVLVERHDALVEQVGGGDRRFGGVELGSGKLWSRPR